MLKGLGRIIFILIGANACLGIDIAVLVSSQYEIKPFLFCDHSHLTKREDTITIRVSEGRGSADFAIVNAISKHVIVIPQNDELAAMYLVKGSFLVS